MPHPSRFVRPERPSSGLVLQPRDREILKSVFTHRLMRSDHVRELLFSGKSLRVAQVRLRKLWEHGYLERCFVPSVLSGETNASVRIGQPVYGLTKKGAELARESFGQDASKTPQRFRKETPGLALLQHHLVVTDFLVSLEAACGRHAGVQVESVESETGLWRKIALWRERSGGRNGYLVPDGAFTLSYPDSGERWSFCLEVVKAGVKGGNSQLLRKMERYVLFHRQGFFKQAYGQEKLRAVIFLTSSEARAERFRVLAKSLKHGRRLFWFGAYMALGPNRKQESPFKPETILSLDWNTAEDDERFSFLQPSRAPSILNDQAHDLCPYPAPGRNQPALAHPGRDHVP